MIPSFLFHGPNGHNNSGKCVQGLCCDHVLYIYINILPRPMINAIHKRRMPGFTPLRAESWSRPMHSLIFFVFGEYFDVVPLMLLFSMALCWELRALDFENARHKFHSMLWNVFWDEQNPSCTLGLRGQVLIYAI